MRTQEEIKNKITEVETDDMFGVKMYHLIDSLTLENAKPYLKEEYLAKVDEGTLEYNTLNPSKEILDYLPFAFQKAINQRGISAARSMDHMEILIWLDNKEFYSGIISSIKSYDDYGIHVLDRIAAKYNYTEADGLI